MSTTPTNAAHRAAELLPCPFCGAAPHETKYVRDGRQVRCVCGASSAPAYHGPSGIKDADARAIDAWNTRAPTAIPEGGLEAEGYVALSVYESAVQGRRDFRAALEIVRSEVQAIRRILAGTDIAALPDDYPTVRMAKDRMADLQAAQQRPAGDWVLVPREPTEEMLLEGYYANAPETSLGWANEVYRAMLSASPTPPLSANPDSGCRRLK